MIRLYGVMTYIVASRTREIGVRVALGATPGAAIRLVMRDAIIMIAAGTTIALPAAWALTRVIAAQLFEGAPFHMPTIAAATLLLSVVALAAAILPAWYASSMKPIDALSAE